MKELETIENQINEINSRIEDPSLGKGTASVMTRVSGYYRSVNNFNEGKQQEYIERKEYDEVSF